MSFCWSFQALFLMFRKLFPSFKKRFFPLPPNPFPFFLSIRLIKLFLGGIGVLHFSFSFSSCCWKLTLIFLICFFWWNSLSSNYLGGVYSFNFERFFRAGFMLFIISEVMFFFGFFWSFFHSCFNPTLFIGSSWPPSLFSRITEDAFRLSNTIILLSSACSITVAHNALIARNLSIFSRFLVLSCLLGFVFVFLQRHEYISSPLRVKSTVYSTTFFLLTGFHGLHVSIGLIFLICNYFRFSQYGYRRKTHQGLEFAIWYWHFVDVVWLFLYICVYHYRGRLLLA